MKKGYQIVKDGCVPEEMAIPEIVETVEKVLKGYQLTIYRYGGELEQPPWITIGCPAGERYGYKVFDAHSWFSFLMPAETKNPTRSAFNIARNILGIKRASRAKFHNTFGGYLGTYKTKTKEPEVLEKELDGRGRLSVLFTSEFEKNRGVGVLRVEVIFRPYTNIEKN